MIGTLGQLVNCGVGSVGYLLLMSGHEKRLIKVQVAMAGVMIAASVALIPHWGIIGAAVAAAITNVGMNMWNLLEVRKALGISPYNRGYYRLIVPLFCMIAATVVLRMSASRFHHDWLSLAVTLIVAYIVFGGATVMVGLDADDRMIISAVWARVRERTGSPVAAQ